QEPDACARCLDEPANVGRLVGAQVIHDDDVAMAQGWQGYLFDIGAERDVVDGAIEDTRGGEPVASQRPRSWCANGHAGQSRAPARFVVPARGPRTCWS